MSAAPVVIVAVMVALGARLAVGLNVAMLVVATYVTDPETFAPPALTVKVDTLIVAGFMVLLKVAVITAVLGQMSVAPVVGVTEITVGAATGSLGATAFLSGSPHPERLSDNASAINQIFKELRIRINTFLLGHGSSHTGP